MWLYLDDKRLPSIYFKQFLSKREKLLTFTNTKSFVECLIHNNNRVTGISLDYNLNCNMQDINNFYIHDCNKYLYTGEDVLEYVLIRKFKNHYLPNLKTIRLHSKSSEIGLRMASLIYTYTTYIDKNVITVIIDPFFYSTYDYISKTGLY